MAKGVSVLSTRGVGTLSQNSLASPTPLSSHCTLTVCTTCSAAATVTVLLHVQLNTLQLFVAAAAHGGDCSPSFAGQNGAPPPQLHCHCSFGFQFPFLHVAARCSFCVAFQPSHRCTMTQSLPDAPTPLFELLQMLVGVRCSMALTPLFVLL